MQLDLQLTLTYLLLRKTNKKLAESAESLLQNYCPSFTKRGVGSQVFWKALGWEFCDLA